MQLDYNQSYILLIVKFFDQVCHMLHDTAALVQVLDTACARVRMYKQLYRLTNFSFSLSTTLD